MERDYLAEFLVGSGTAVATALVGYAIAGSVQWIWVAVGFVIPILVLVLYRGVIPLPFSRLRQYRIRDGELISYFGSQKGDVREFDASSNEGAGFYGPYIPLPKGKYTVSFHLKIDNRSEQDQPVCELDVTSNDGCKWFAQYTVSLRDFKEPEKWQDFPLDFVLPRDENRVEFRLRMKDVLIAQRRVSFQHLALRKRLF
jgi:hypothetical protein